MTAELTAEEIVTNLLSSHEILKRKKGNFYVSNEPSLGTYLESLPIESMGSDTTSSSTLSIEEELEAKYTFIKEGGWKF